MINERYELFISWLTHVRTARPGPKIARSSVLVFVLDFERHWGSEVNVSEYCCCSLFELCGMSDTGDSDESPFSEGESEVS